MALASWPGWSSASWPGSTGHDGIAGLHGSPWKRRLHRASRYGMVRAAREGVFSAPPRRCRSSVVEHSLGKGEVRSSILRGSTIHTPARLNTRFPATGGLRLERRANLADRRQLDGHRPIIGLGHLIGTGPKQLDLPRSFGALDRDDQIERLGTLLSVEDWSAIDDDSEAGLFSPAGKLSTLARMASAIRAAAPAGGIVGSFVLAEYPIRARFGLLPPGRLLDGSRCQAGC